MAVARGVSIGKSVENGRCWTAGIGRIPKFEKVAVAVAADRLLWTFSGASSSFSGGSDFDAGMLARRRPRSISQIAVPGIAKAASRCIQRREKLLPIPQVIFTTRG